jgi:hypothetical protein
MSRLDKVFKKVCGNLTFLGYVGNISLNNMTIEKRILNNDTYRLVKYTTNACGNFSGEINYIDIKIDDYAQLRDDYEIDSLFFSAVADLFEED